MKHSLYMICGSFVFVLMTVNVALTAPPTESMAGLWHADYEDPKAGCFVKLGDYPPVPADVQADVDAFNQSLLGAPVHLREGWIATSPNGLAFGIGSIARSDEPLGVWIWPNWRDATPIIFEQYNYFSFVSHANRYVVLYGSRGIDSAPTVVVDLQDPETFYPLPGVTKSRRYLHVTDEGRWAGVAAARTTLLVGQLDPEQPNDGAEEAEEILLPEAGRVDNLGWVRNGEFLVVEVQLDATDVLKLFVIRGDDLTVVDSAENARMFFGGSTEGDTSFFGGMNAQRAFITVSSDGELSGQPTGFPQEADGRERPAAASPSGWFTMTYWDKVEIVPDEDGVDMLTERIETEIRRTPLADPEEPLPTWPTHEVDGEELTAGIYFWLSWE